MFTGVVVILSNQSEGSFYFICYSITKFLFLKLLHIQEFKLNPEAKIFSPSYTKRLSQSPVGMSDGKNIAYISSNTTMPPVPEAIYPEVGNNPYMPQASPPSKFVPYGNITAGHAVGGFQFSQHVSIIFFNIVPPYLTLFRLVMSKGFYQLVIENRLLLSPLSACMVNT